MKVLESTVTFFSNWDAHQTIFILILLITDHFQKLRNVKSMGHYPVMMVDKKWCVL